MVLAHDHLFLDFIYKQDTLGNREINSVLECHSACVSCSYGQPKQKQVKLICKVALTLELLYNGP